MWFCRIFGHRWRYGYWKALTDGGFGRQSQCWRCDMEQMEFCDKAPIDVISKGVIEVIEYRD